jgi:hypothetical protein
MLLGFKRKLPSGEPTHFFEKIFNGVGVKVALSDVSPDSIKLHSIREGERWRAGMSIQMAFGVRTKNYYQFNKGFEDKLGTCISVQSIEMDFCPDDNSIGMKIDGRIVSKYVIREVVLNDGLTRQQFIEWFFSEKTSFKGQIIHWTPLRYEREEGKGSVTTLYNHIKQHR